MKNCGSGPWTACVVGHAHYVIGSQCLFSHRSACGDKVHSTTKPAWKKVNHAWDRWEEFGGQGYSGFFLTKNYLRLGTPSLVAGKSALMLLAALGSLVQHKISKMTL